MADHPPWLGTVERGGLPIPPRADVPTPPHWRLEAVAATERPGTWPSLPTVALRPSSGTGTPPMSGPSTPRRG